MNQRISPGVVHQVPDDLKNALSKNPKSLAQWETLTPLGRNEWICWTISVKKDETRKKHIERVVDEVGNGKRRPCCWPGCSHR